MWSYHESPRVGRARSAFNISNHARGRRCRWANDKDALRNIKEPGMVERLKEYVLTAERALLYALGFQFRRAHPSILHPVAGTHHCSQFHTCFLC